MQRKPVRVTQLSVAKLTKRYGTERALASVTAEFHAGQVTAVLGHNGAGKSTLLALLTTLVKPSSGKLTAHSASGPVFGQDLRAAIGLLSHASLIYPELSGLENITLFARLAGNETPEASARALLKSVGLEERDHHRVARNYSRGMMQRLSLARALIHEPSVLLLDEPYTGLDPDASEQLTERIAREKANGTIVICVTHDFSSLAKITDRVLLLRRGAVVMDERGTFSPDRLHEMYGANHAQETRI